MPAKRGILDAATTAPKRAAIYIRVSTLHQIDKDSLPMQRQELAAYCKLVLGIEDFIIFEDPGYSGKNTYRPDYQRMMGQIRNGLFTHLVVWKIDRISRNLLDFAAMFEELKKHDVTFVSKNEQFDTSTAMGEAMLKIILIFAELERKMTSERVTATMINRATNGIWNGGRIPYGYAHDEKGGAFSFDDKEAAVVRLIFDEYEKTRSIVRTSRYINEIGYRSRAGSLFSPVSVWIILRNPWYKGTYRYNYRKTPSNDLKDKEEWVIVDEHHPAIIEAARFDAIQVTLDSNARYRNLPGRSVQRLHTNIFSGLLWCADCGAAFTASPGKLHANGYRPSKYGCPNVRKTKTCHAKYVADTVIGEFLLNYILNIINAQKGFADIDTPEELERRLLRGSSFADIEEIDEDGLNALWDMLCSFKPSDSVLTKRPKMKQKADPELKRLRADQMKHERALERLNQVYLYGDGAMSEREYFVRRQEIMDALQEVNDAIGLVQQEPWSKSMTDEDFLAQASTFIINQKLQGREYIYFKNLAENTDPEILQAFFQSILDSVTLRAGRAETVVFRNGLAHSFKYKEEAEA